MTPCIHIFSHIHTFPQYILENILLNIFEFYILKYIIKFLQGHDNNNKKKFDFRNFAEHLQKARETPVKNQCFRL